ncbi:hypothetical protein D0A34_18965 [Microcoleus vaginatus PCC 9802]|nr:hypothetical protein MicvaDRAFT_2248 [Microcoleus vaginatus FGP-2]UNU20684.1 hypothetical protein D0A34_18965 [Microcoleus vaginatus PCC 9802]
MEIGKIPVPQILATRFRACSTNISNRLSGLFHKYQIFLWGVGLGSYSPPSKAYLQMNQLNF